MSTVLNTRFIQPDFPTSSQSYSSQNFSSSQNFEDFEMEVKRPDITYNPSSTLTDPYLISQVSKIFKFSRSRAKAQKQLDALRDQKDSNIVRHWNVVRSNGSQFKSDDVKLNYEKAAINLNKKFTLELLDLKISSTEKDLDYAEKNEKECFRESIDNFRSQFENDLFTLDNQSFDKFRKEYVETQLSLFCVSVVSNRAKLAKENEFTSPNDEQSAKFRTKMEKLFKPKRGRPPQAQPRKSVRPTGTSAQKFTRRFRKNKNNSNRNFRNRNPRNVNFRYKNDNKQNDFRKRKRGYRPNFKKRTNSYNDNRRRQFSHPRADRRGRGRSYVTNLSKTPIPSEVEKIFKNGYKFIPTNRDKSKFLRDLSTSQESWKFSLERAFQESLGKTTGFRKWQALEGKFSLKCKEFSSWVDSNSESLKSKHNMYKKDRDILFDLKHHKTHMIVMTDKNLGPAWIERDVWFKACQDSLNSEDFTHFSWVGLEVEEFSKNTISNLIGSAPNFIWNTKDKAIMTLKCKNLEQNIPKYGPLVKIHKKSIWPLKLRSVIRGGNWVSDPISRFLNKELWIIIHKLEISLKFRVILENSFDLVNYFEDKFYTERPFFVSFDVVALYPSIQKNQMFDCLHWAGIVLGLREDFVIFLTDCIRAIQDTAFFKFETEYFRLNNGCTMGSSFAAPIANLVLFYYECNAKEKKN